MSSQYDPTVPVATNQVRGASGDLIAMQRNFECLLPILASGLNSLISGGANVSGAVAIVQAGGANPQWHVALLPIGTLADVALSSPVSGQVLKFDGSNWINDTDLDTGGGGGGSGGGGTLDSQITVSMASGGTQTVPDSTETVALISGVVRENRGNWSYNAPSGEITVPAGVTHIRVVGQAAWAAAGGATLRSIKVKINGLRPDAMEPDGRFTGAAATVDSVGIATSLIPVSQGDKVTMVVVQSDGGNLDLVGGSANEGRLTFLSVQGYFIVSGVAAQEDQFSQCRVTLPSGGTESIPNNSATVVSGLIERENTAGDWTVTASGSIIVPSGLFTHVQVFAQAAWEDAAPVSDTSFREITLLKDGSVELGVPGISSRNRLRAARNVGNVTVTPFIAVSGGEEFQLQATQNDGGALDLLGGTNTNGGLTAMSIRGYNLTSGQSRPRTSVRVTSGTVETITDDTPTVILISGDQTTDVGGWTYTAASGTVAVPAGVTHVRAHVQVRWEGTLSPAGYRDAQLLLNGTAVPDTDVHDRRAPIDDTPASVTIQSFSSGLIPVTPGDLFSVSVRHTHGSDLDIQPGSQGVTWLKLEGIRLTT